MELLQWFEKGLTAQQYINNMNTHKENLEKVYTSFQLSEANKEALLNIPISGVKVIVLTEDWCGDAMVNIPILLHIAEETNIDVRFILRDSNLELMDQYLTNGTARSIPIFIFIDEVGNELAVWGPRAPKVQQQVDELKAQLPSPEAPDFKEKQLGMFKKFVSKFTEDEATWQVIADSIIDKMKDIRL
ncbi:MULTISPECIES: thioredoxin family protein [Bacillaceae]|uniref:Thioredoxin family protein n=1 Tax=Evansella alkalicola TaxID=745819 RepID=A0ABS6JVZ7_9BACI|nr:MULTISPECIES: thioredoxin family protein [Bacillaceae]MBU9722768.1 thioredoxin family protein [Bacillus alkalicola]